jgi:hypothetical protein
MPCFHILLWRCSYVLLPGAVDLWNYYLDITILWSKVPYLGSTPRHTDWLTVSHKVTLTLTWLYVASNFGLPSFSCPCHNGISWNKMIHIVPTWSSTHWMKNMSSVTFWISWVCHGIFIHSEMEGCHPALCPFSFRSMTYPPPKWDCGLWFWMFFHVFVFYLFHISYSANMPLM